MEQEEEVAEVGVKAVLVAVRMTSSSDNFL